MKLNLEIEYKKLTVERINDNSGVLHFDDTKIPYTGFHGFTGGADYHTPYGTLKLGSCMHPNANIHYVSDHLPKTLSGNLV